MADKDNDKSKPADNDAFGQPRPKLVLIKFLVGQPPYNAGETAGFPEEVAERYLSARVKIAGQAGQSRVAERAHEPAILGVKG